MRRSLILVLVALAGPMALAVPYDVTVLGDNPIAYWRFNETSGTNADDAAAGSLHDGTYLGGYTLGQPSASSALGTAVAFNGSSARVQVPDNAAFDLGTGNYTIETWYNTNSTSRGDIFTYKGGGGDLGVHSASQGAGIISLYHDGFIATSPAVPINTWHHLAITRSGTAVTMYIDGVVRASGTSSNSWNIANDLLIGSNHSGSPANPSSFFSGLLDEFALYGSALTQAQVYRHYEVGAGIANRIGLNFVGGNGPGNGQTRTLSNANGLAGIVPQLFWNNGTGAANTLNSLIDNTGAATAASITWNGSTTYSTGNGSSTANHILMNGYVDRADGSPLSATFSVSNIPYAVYNVYVYTDSDAGDGRDESFHLIAGAGDYGTVFVNDITNFSGTFTQATATTQDGPGASGNYVLFEYIRDSSFTLTATAQNFRYFVNGMQIVEVTPEPTSLSLLGLGLLALARRRRQKRA